MVNTQAGTGGYGLSGFRIHGPRIWRTLARKSSKLACWKVRFNRLNHARRSMILMTLAMVIWLARWRR